MFSNYLAKLKIFLRHSLWRVSPNLFDLCVGKFEGQVFSISVAHGTSPLTLNVDIKPTLTAADVTDAPAAFVADPFILLDNNNWYMFFEVLNRITRQGEISFAYSTDGINWSYGGRVLQEPFHLAYPLVFKWQGDYYMLPDNKSSNVTLYRATNFPTRWEPATKVLTNGHYCDSTMFEYNGSWWMFSGIKDGPDTQCSLKLFYADSPVDDWTEHPCNPLIQFDDRYARPAGRVMIIDGELYRFSQNCETRYGEAVDAFKITELTRQSYVEEIVTNSPILMAGESHWHNGGMHHIDGINIEPNSWIASVDGWH